MSIAWEILELARWAPSGDNTQPWRFEVPADDHIVVHAFDTRRGCLYDLGGRASQLSVGALLETIRIAASLHGLSTEVARRAGDTDELPVFDVRLVPARTIAADPLHSAVRNRSVQRRPLSTRRLSEADKAALARSLGDGHAVVWFEALRERARLAWLAVRSARIRLTIPEAYAVHREVIAWNARFSDDRIPDQALGAGAASLRSMRWAMQSWERVRLMNRWFAGTLAPRLELDLLPGLRCGAHFAIVASRDATTLDDQLAAGAAVQRFWLTAASRRLQLQPQYTPLVFAACARDKIAFTGDLEALARADEVNASLGALLGSKAAATVFLGRIGHGPAPVARSLRLPMERLIWRADESPFAAARHA